MLPPCVCSSLDTCHLDSHSNNWPSVVHCRMPMLVLTAIACKLPLLDNTLSSSPQATPPKTVVGHPSPPFLLCHSGLWPPGGGGSTEHLGLICPQHKSDVACNIWCLFGFPDKGYSAFSWQPLLAYTPASVIQAPEHRAICHSVLPIPSYCSNSRCTHSLWQFW